MRIIPLKPLSINRAYRGQMFATSELKSFKLNCAKLLPRNPGCAVDGKLKLTMQFGFSNPAQDIDGPIKSCQDALEKKYGFNDRQIYELIIRKELVKKGTEYWAFELDVIE